jgi:hypothetical protein
MPYCLLVCKVESNSEGIGRSLQFDCMVFLHVDSVFIPGLGSCAIEDTFGPRVVQKCDCL